MSKPEWLDKVADAARLLLEAYDLAEELHPGTGAAQRLEAAHEQIDSILWDHGWEDTEGGGS